MQRGLSAMLVLTLAGCGGTPADAPGPRASDSVAALPDVDACAVLREIDWPAVTGAAPERVTEAMRSVTDEVAVAQCVAAFPGEHRTLSLMVRVPARGRNPATREEWAERITTGVLAADPGVAQAATTVSGLGDLAVLYDMDGPNLAVFWKDRREMVVTSYGFADAAVARRALEAIARQALTRH